MNALVPVQMSNAEAYRASTDAADLCRQIVLATALTLGKGNDADIFVFG